MFNGLGHKHAYNHTYLLDEYLNIDVDTITRVV